MQIDIVNEWIFFYKMTFTVDLRIDIRTMEMLYITPNQKSCVIAWVISIVKNA